MSNSLFVKEDGRNKRILFNDIIYVEACGNYVRIHTSKKYFVAHHTLKQIEKHLPSEYFCKVHKSYIIAIDKLTEFDHRSVLLGSVELPVSIQFIEILKSKLNIVSSDKKSGIKDQAHLNGSIVYKN